MQYSPNCTSKLPARAEEAFYGLVGEFVGLVELLQFLVAFGGVAGRSPYFRVEADRHTANLYAVLVGNTAKSRKGTSFSHVKRMLQTVDPEWAGKCIATGLSSGEGLSWAVRDPIERSEPIKEKKKVISYRTVIDDQGVEDKRLLVYEPEFASVLKVASREGLPA